MNQRSISEFVFYEKRALNILFKGKGKEDNLKEIISISEKRARFLKFVQPRVFVHNDGSFNTYGWESDPDIPETSGVYLLVVNYYKDLHDILYIGSAINLKKRLKNHERIKECRERFGYSSVKIIYKPMRRNYLDFEMRLIQSLAPFMNKKFYQ